MNTGQWNPPQAPSDAAIPDEGCTSATDLVPFGIALRVPSGRLPEESWALRGSSKATSMLRTDRAEIRDGVLMFLNGKRLQNRTLDFCSVAPELSRLSIGPCRRTDATTLAIRGIFLSLSRRGFLSPHPRPLCRHVQVGSGMFDFA